MSFKRIICVLGIFLCAVLYAGSLEDVIQQAENAIAEKYKTPIAKKSAVKKLVAIIDDADLTDEQKIADLKKAFPEAFKKEELPLIFTPQVSYHIHSLALGYDIQESSTQTITTVDIFKKINSSKTQNESSEKKDIRSQHKVNVDVSAGNEFSLNPFTWLKILFDTKVKLSGSYTYGRDSVNQQSELWSRSQQEIFSRESSQI
ncbi:MAG: hypothetical protein IKD09_01780, partial [Lentisphaeria bacterium]|nr:hypothetical protein [Lentisphaeria bacterium]